MDIKNITFAALAICTLISTPALAKPACSTAAMAGSWIFATGVGRQALPGFPADKDITALGSMNIDAYGNISGTFDATVEELHEFPAPLHGIPYSGSIVINADCRGVLEFVTGAGTSRVDSVAVISRKEVRGMSRDPNNLWTYELLRIRQGKGHSKD